MTKIKAKLALLLEQLNYGLVDREATMKSALLSVLAGENMLLIGPPGTAKSLVARRISKIFNENNQADTTTYFEYLLTKFSTPEEIFGPLSISELKADRFKRNTDGYLPSVKIAFLDEVFKASSSILNALLTIMNERIYHNGTKAEDVPLRALIAASNELPTGQEELSALYDRFLVRSFVDYISANKLLHLFDLSEEVEIQDPLTQEDLNWLDDTIKNITISAEIRKAILEIWEKHKDTFKEDRREVLSDRRFTKVIKLLRVSAATNDRSEVDLSDVLLLKDCLWNHPDNAKKMREIVLSTLRVYSRKVEVNRESKTSIEKVNNELLQELNVSNSFKGYRGNGTECDPLLIGNLDELLGMSRAEIGLQGLYFKQICDIDCSEIPKWSPILFKGHYNGSCYSIKKTNRNEVLFKRISNSSFTSLNLLGFILADYACESNIYDCKTNQSLIRGNAENCHFSACEVSNKFIHGNAKSCDFYDCYSGNSLIFDSAENCIVKNCKIDSTILAQNNSKAGEAKNCEFYNCIVSIPYLITVPENFGGFARSLINCSVENCFVSMNNKGVTASNNQKNHYETTINKGICGFASICDNSTITNCVLGEFNHPNLVRGITSKTFRNAKLFNNAVIDSNKFSGRTDNENGKDGKVIPVIQFNQYFFENQLHWNFEETWKWDSNTKSPSFRHKIGTTKTDSSLYIEKIDLFTTQIKNNIWL